MGDRANLVVLKRKEWRLYYDHWRSVTLDAELFWGPQLATEFIEQREPVDPDDGWINEIDCDAGAIIDHDRQILLWYGGDDTKYDVPRRRAFLSLMEAQWPNWEIRWAHGGIVELGSHLGVPAERFLWRYTGWNPEYLLKLRLFQRAPEYGNTLLTLRNKGVVSVVRVHGDAGTLKLGSNQIPRILGFPSGTSLDWTGEMPWMGVHIDVDEHSLSYWFAEPCVAIEERVGQAWPGWQTRWLYDKYEEHLKMVPLDIRLPIRTTTELQLDIIEYLRTNVHIQSRNLAGNVASDLGDLGARGVWVNPWTRETRGSVGDARQKLQLIERIEDAIRTQDG